MRRLLLLSIMILFSCSDDDSGEGIRPDDGSPGISEDVVVILDENSDLISTEEEIAEGVYKLQFSTSPPEIKDGDIIVGDEGMGFLRRATTVSTEGNVVTMQTDRAFMDEVFQNQQISFESDLVGVGRSNQQGYSGIWSTHIAEGVRVNDNNFSFDFDNVTVFQGDGVVVRIPSGNLSFNPNFQFDLDYGFFTVDKLEIGTENTTFSSNVDYQVTVASSASTSEDLLSLYQGNKTFVRWIGGVPVVVTIFLDLKVVTSIGVDSEFNFNTGMTIDASFTAKATYENGSWQTSSNLDSSFTQRPVEIDGAVSVTESITLVPEVIVAFYGINGPLLQPNFSGDLTANVATPSLDWDADISGHIAIDYGISKGVLGKTFSELPLGTLEVTSQPIWNVPDAIELVSPATVNGTQGEPIEDPVRVKIVDNLGLSFSDVPVNFQVTTGGGTVSEERVFTDEDGFAETTWTLGNETGEQTMQAYVLLADGSAATTEPVVVRATTDSNKIDLSGTWNALTDPALPGSCDNGEDPGLWNLNFIFNEGNGTITFTASSGHNTAFETTDYTLNDNQLYFSINVFVAILPNNCNGPISMEYDLTFTFEGEYDYDSGNFIGDIYINHNLIPEYPQCGFVDWNCQRPMIINN
ncbi:MAG: hypothetical protein CMC13_16135 [Flavobacteriaceae bacterium]|nr:hypothetical protein [Flavobacteriaceae bacterium]